MRTDTEIQNTGNKVTINTVKLTQTQHAGNKRKNSNAIGASETTDSTTEAATSTPSSLTATATAAVEPETQGQASKAKRAKTVTSATSEVTKAVANTATTLQAYPCPDAISSSSVESRASFNNFSLVVKQKTTLELLMGAVLKNDLYEVNTLLAEPTFLNNDENSKQIILKAIVMGNLGILERLLKIPAIQNVIASDAQGDNQVLKFAVSDYRLISVKSQKDFRIRNYGLAVVEQLLRNQAVLETLIKDVKTRNKILNAAACSGDIEILDRLLGVPEILTAIDDEIKENINVEDGEELDNGSRILPLAMKFGRLEFIKRLCDLVGLNEPEEITNGELLGERGQLLRQFKVIDFMLKGGYVKVLKWIIEEKGLYESSILQYPSTYFDRIIGYGHLKFIYEFLRPDVGEPNCNYDKRDGVGEVLESVVCEGHLTMLALLRQQILFNDSDLLDSEKSEVLDFERISLILKFAAEKSQEKLLTWLLQIPEVLDYVKVHYAKVLCYAPTSKRTDVEDNKRVAFLKQLFKIPEVMGMVIFRVSTLEDNAILHKMCMNGDVIGLKILLSIPQILTALRKDVKAINLILSVEDQCDSGFIKLFVNKLDLLDGLVASGKQGDPLSLIAIVASENMAAIEKVKTALIVYAQQKNNRLMNLMVELENSEIVKWLLQIPEILTVVKAHPYLHHRVVACTKQENVKQFLLMPEVREKIVAIARADIYIGQPLLCLQKAIRVNNRVVMDLLLQGESLIAQALIRAVDIEDIKVTIESFTLAIFWGHLAALEKLLQIPEIHTALPVDFPTLLIKKLEELDSAPHVKNIGILSRHIPVFEGLLKVPEVAIAFVQGRWESIHEILLLAANEDMHAFERLLSLPIIAAHAHVSNNKLLWMAARHGYLAAVSRLLMLSSVQLAIIESEQVADNQVLWEASSHGEAAVVDFLLNFPSIRNNVDAFDDFALRMAVWRPKTTEERDTQSLAKFAPDLAEEDYLEEQNYLNTAYVLCQIYRSQKKSLPYLFINENSLDNFYDYYKIFLQPSKNQLETLFPGRGLIPIICAYAKIPLSCFMDPIEFSSLKLDTKVKATASASTASESTKTGVTTPDLKMDKEALMMAFSQTARALAVPTALVNNTIASDRPIQQLNALDSMKASLARAFNLN